MTHRYDMSPYGGRPGKRSVLALAAAVGVLVILLVAIVMRESADQTNSGSSGPLAGPGPTTRSPTAPPTSPTLPTTPASSTPRTSAPSTATSPSNTKPSSPPPTHPSTSSTSGSSTSLALRPSPPRSVIVPAIGLHSSIVPIGKNPDGTLAVPQPGPDLDKVAWYHYSSTPGSAGPSVLEGHVETSAGPSVFARLDEVKVGESISATRADGKTAVFTVTAVRHYATAFPVHAVFAAQLAVPSLRLVTCNDVDRTTGRRLGYTVVYARMTSVRPT